MKRKRRTDQEKARIVQAIKKAMAQGETLKQACLDHGVSPGNYYKWMALKDALPVDDPLLKVPPILPVDGKPMIVCALPMSAPVLSPTFMSEHQSYILIRCSPKRIGALIDLYGYVITHGMESEIQDLMREVNGGEHPSPASN